MLALLSLQVVKEEQLDHRGTVQQFIRQSNGGSRPEGQNVASTNHFAGKYLPTTALGLTVKINTVKHKTHNISVNKLFPMFETLNIISIGRIIY